MQQKASMPNTFAAKLKFYRTQLGLSQSQIPGFNHTTISRYESGQHCPLRRRLRDLAKALGVTPEDLMEPSPIRLPAIRSRSYAAAQEYLEQGYVHEAYAVGRVFSRQAYQTGDPDAMTRADQLMRQIIDSIPDDALFHTAFASLEDPVILHKLSSIAARNQEWHWALTINEALLTRGWCR